MAPGMSSSSSRILINVKVSESPGPIRLLVNQGDSVEAVIRRVIKEYTRQRRLPVLGEDPGYFDLWCASVDRALSSCEIIGSSGGRNFWMCKKQDCTNLRMCTATVKKSSFFSKAINLIRLF